MGSNTDSNTQESSRFNFNIAKWILVTILLIFAIVGNYYFRQYNPILRVIVVIAIIVLAGGIALQTTTGKAILVFAREARFEMHKVIWPTRQETLQTTLIVILVTIFMALTLLGLDGILVYLVSFITNLRF